MSINFTWTTLSIEEITEDTWEDKISRQARLNLSEVN